ncbi:MAG TPA: M3 family metallopeptidase [Puia sp.]|nr:M3 family metallopeptidase [Puia sp.]
MLFTKFSISVILCFMISAAISQAPPPNPLLIHSNNPIAFDKVDAKIIRQAVEQIIQLSNKRVNQIITGLKPGSGPGSVLAVYDLMSYDLNDLGAKLGLISQTYTDDSARNAANDGSQALADYQTSLILNVPFYKAFKKYADTSLPVLKPNQKKYVQEQIRIFENNGMKLDSNGRKRLQVISDKMTMLGISFDRNIGMYKDSIIYSEKDLPGIPENQKKSWRRQAGLYVVYVNTPNLTEIIEHAVSDDTRKLMLTRYWNRAYPQNIKVLDSLLYYRQQYAKMLGYKSYAAYALTDKMAANPQTVWNFENNLIQKLTPRVTSDLASIRAIKHQMHPELPDTIFSWDVRYYKNILLDTKYQLNTEELKEYFEMNETIRGIFEVYHRLLGITVKEISGRPTWYSKVRSFEMYVGAKKVGNFYFDLYPRQDKYTHFACFPISEANVIGGKEILPVAALICNFPEGAKGDPTLLSHEDVITFFHEFGHLVHYMVVRSNLASQPYTIKADFVEAPSQFLENFCWEYASLKIFAKNYKTGEVLPDTLFNKLKATRHVLDASNYMQQIYYGLIDFTFEDKYDSIRAMDLTTVSKNLQRITQVPFLDGTHMIASFGHLNGYGANYYGYLWSLVFAQDIFSVFEKNGVMDAKTGERYRKEILEVAASEEEMDMLRHFLGREPNSEAFMKSLGL